MGAFNDFVLFFSLASFAGFFFFYYKYQHSHQITIEIPERALEETLLELEVQHEQQQLQQISLPSVSSVVSDSIPGEFLPGSLTISGEEVLRQCYLEPDH